MNEEEAITQRNKKTLLQKYEITLDQLSFKFVAECRDVKLLERIVRILRSGEEGYYPDLTKTAEEQLGKIHPNSRILRVETPVLTKGMIDSKRWDQISNELIEWSDDIKDKDLKLKNNIHNKNIIENKYQRGIRKFEMKEALKNEENKSTKKKSVVQKSYAEWEKYNPEVDLLKMDVEEDKIKEEKKRKQKEKIQLLNDDLDEEIKREKKAIEEADYTEEEKLHLSIKEKEKGNESHINREYKNAIKHYTKSLMLHSSSVVYNNRAISYIKLNQFTDALKDANKVLEKEPNNIKALYRRGQAYQNLKYFQKAYNDFLKIIELDPNNDGVQIIVKQIESRCYNNNKIVRRMKIQEEDSSQSYQKVFEIPEPEKNIRLNEWGLATSMCSCTSEPDWLKDRNVHKYVSTDLSVDSNPKAHLKTNSNNNQPLKDMPTLDNEDQISTSVKKENKSSINSAPKPHPKPIILEKIKIPQKITSFEFTKIWQTIKNDNTYEQHYQLLKSINPHKLNNLIGNNLDSEMLSIILNCIDKFFLKNTNHSQLNMVLLILNNLIKLPRFEINFLLMKNSKVSESIFLKLSKENITIPMELTKAFSNYSS